MQPIFEKKCKWEKKAAYTTDLDVKLLKNQVKMTTDLVQKFLKQLIWSLKYRFGPRTVKI